jgi:hypothetical protein
MEVYSEWLQIRSLAILVSGKPSACIWQVCFLFLNFFLISHIRLSIASLNILIIGGGIAGFAAATSLAQKGHQATVLESKPSLSEVGVGIQVSPNALVCLDAWGLKERFNEVGGIAAISQVRRYNTGELLGKIALDTEDVYGYR